MRKRPTNRRQHWVMPAIAAAMTMTGVVLWQSGWSSPATAGQPAPLQPVPAQPQSADVLAPSIDTGGPLNLRRTVTVQVVQKTKGAVVNISTRKIVTERVVVNDVFQRPMETGQVVHVPASSLGSGFIIHPDGYVVTNNHVIERARQITVDLDDGRSLPADLISADPDADLAILRIRADKPFPTLALGDSDDLMIGEPVIAIGNPLGYSHSVSTGIVSAKHRDIKNQATPARPTPAQQPKPEDTALRDLVQTDAAINPGNSGGPLLNAYGQVIGINTAIRSDAQNIGFAIPIDRLRDLIPELMNPSSVSKVDVPVKFAEKRSVTEPSTITATVVSAGPNGTAVDSINGRHPADLVDAYAQLLTIKADTPVDVAYAGGKPAHLMTHAAPIPDAIVQAKKRLGITIDQNTPMLAGKYQLSREDGLLVTSVDPDSIGAAAELQPGDLIVQLGRYPTLSLQDFGALVPHFPDSGQVMVIVVRGRQGLRTVFKF